MSDNYRELDGIEVDGTPVKFNAANVLTNVGGVFVVDNTLSIPGAAADAKKTGDEIGDLKEDLSDKISKPSESPNGTSGQLLRTNGDGSTTWVDEGLPTDEQTAEAVTAWLNAHPEATTSVEDNSLTYAKLVTGTLDFVTAEMFGAKGDGTTDDTSALVNALSSGYPVSLKEGATYIVTDAEVPHGFVLNGNGATIKRPNLKASPYNRTDQQIKGERIIKFSTTNRGKQTVFRDVIFDGNAFVMWQPSDEYKYEQAPLLAIGGASDNQAKILFDNCTFKDNYASGVSVSNYVDIKLINCFVSNCFKTAMTFVGYGSNAVVENLSHKNTVSYKNFFGPTHCEINTTDYVSDPESNYTVRGIKGEVGVVFGGMTGKGTNNISDVDISGIGTSSDNGSAIVIINAVNGVANVNNCVFRFAQNAVSCIKFNGRGNFDIEVTDTLFDASLAPDSFVSFNPYDDSVGVIRFTNCVFRGMKYGMWIARNQNSHNVNMIFDKCKFENITTQAVGSGDVSAFHLDAITFTNCMFKIGANAYIYKQDGSGTRQPVLRFSGNKILGENAGIRIYGLSADTLIFDNELWDAGCAVSYYRSSRAPRVFGMRYRIVTSAPTGLAFNDHDTALLVDENGAITATYLYTGNQWALQS